MVDFSRVYCYYSDGGGGSGEKALLKKCRKFGGVAGVKRLKEPPVHVTCKKRKYVMRGKRRKKNGLG